MLVCIWLSGFNPTLYAQDPSEVCICGVDGTARYIGDNPLQPLCRTDASIEVNLENGNDCDTPVDIEILIAADIQGATNLSEIFSILVYEESLGLTIIKDEISSIGDGNFPARRIVLRGLVVPGVPAEGGLGKLNSVISFKLDPILSSIIKDNFFFYVTLLSTNAEQGDIPCSPRLLLGDITQIGNNGNFNFDASYIPARGNTSITGLASAGLLSGTTNTSALFLAPLPGGAPPILTIDVPEFLINGRSRLLMSPGAKVIVPAGSTLILEGTNMFTCPDYDLAEGIIVQPGGKLVTRTGSQSQGGQIPTPSLLSDAHYAINALPGSILDINNTEFTNNYIGLNLDMTAAPAGQERVVINSFQNNTFRTTKPLKPAYSGMSDKVRERGFTGIQLRNYQDFNVAQNTKFSELENGLVAFRSNLNIGNMTFNNIGAADGDASDAYPFTGRGISMVSPQNNRWGFLNAFGFSMTFENCETGVFAQGMAGAVKNCTMKNITTGIDWNNSRNRDIVIADNVITARKLGIRSFRNEPLSPVTESKMSNNIITIQETTIGTEPTFGIQAAELANKPKGIGWRITGNTVTMKRGSTGIKYLNGFGGQLNSNTVVNQLQSQNYNGIDIESAEFSTVTGNTITQSGAAGLGYSQGIRSGGGSSNEFNCNCLDNTNTGMQFYDMADFTDAVKGNRFNTHVTGMRLGDPFYPSVYIGTQTHTGNLWDLAFASGNGNFGAVNYNVGGLNGSQFVVDQKENVRFLPMVNPASSWFFNIPDEPLSYSCSSACAFPPGFSGGSPDDALVTGLDKLIRFGQISGSADFQWKANYRLYRKLLRQPSLANLSTFATWKSDQQNTSAGRLAEIAEARSALLQLNASQLSAAAALQTQLRQQADQVKTMDDQQMNTPNPTFSTAQYKTVLQQKNSTQVQSDQFWADIRSNQVAQAQALLLQNAAITTQITADANHKTVNALALKLLIDDALTTTDLNTLDAIALQCPSEGGDAVYEARAVAGYYLARTYNDAACGIGERANDETKKVLTSAKTVVLSPNPTTGWITVQGQEVKHVTVMDQLGRIIADQPVSNNEMDLTDLGNGLYYVHLVSEDGVRIAIQKVVIAR
jgi:hypothetical protein